jgi:hypothetical protein
MMARHSMSARRARQLQELEAENLRLRQAAADLTGYLRALQDALTCRGPAPRRPACIAHGAPER